VSFDVNVSGAAGGIKSPGGLGGGNPSPGEGESGVSLRYHTHKEFLDINKDQRNELSEWTKANRARRNKVVANVKVIPHVDLPKLATPTNDSRP
jgi:hypothetical protein